MTYTYKLSALNGTNGFRLDGIAADDLTGLSVSGAGDVNGDGFDDLLIGSHTSDFNANLSGAAYLVYGKAGGFAAHIDLGSLNGTTGVRFEGESAIDVAGFSVSAAGDINGDGRDDFMISSFLADKTGFNSGSTYVIYGTGAAQPPVVQLADISGTAGFRIDGAEARGYAGIAVTEAGDVNGDGINDIIIGASGLLNSYGQVVGAAYVVFGNKGGFGDTFNLAALDGSNGFKIANAVAFEGIGLAVGGNGDFNGDGFADVIVSAINANADGGRAFIVFGKASGLPASIDVSTLDGSNGFIINGSGGQDLGKAIASAGDIDGDGIDDLVVTADTTNSDGQPGAEGAAYVIFGNKQGFSSNFDLSSLNGANGFRLAGGSGQLVGTSVASAGDVNGDGFADLLIGADALSGNAGGAYLVFGKAGGFAAVTDLSKLAWSDGFRIDGVAAGDEAGVGVKAAGDINGDGYDDIIVGAYMADPGGHSNAGSGYVIFGSGDIVLPPGIDLATLPADQGFRVAGAAAYSAFGLSVSAAGDINGDGRDDFIVGAPGGVFPDGGKAYVVFGRDGNFPKTFNISNINGSNGFVIDGAAAGAGMGKAVSNAGDINGDGIDDLAVYSRFATAGAGDTPGNDRGVTYIIFGKDTGFAKTIDVGGLNGSNGFRISGTTDKDHAGSALATGDINGDGFADLVLGAPGADNGGNYSGSTYVVFGKPTGFTANINLESLNGSNGFRIDGAAPNDYSGFDVGAGDFNGDGRDDVVIGASTANIGKSAPGVVYLVFGNGSFATPSLNAGNLNGTNGYRFSGIADGDGTGNSVANAGDINGDGIDDLIIGAVTAKSAATHPGMTYVVFGGSANFMALDAADGTVNGKIALARLTGANGFTITGERVHDYLGCSVRGAGDVNGDGFADLIVGAYSASPHGSHEGSAFVIFGKASGFGNNVNVADLNGRNGFRIDGAAANSETGYAVSAAGDVNHDGFDDLMVSMPGTTGSAGSTYVIYGHEPDFAVTRTGTSAAQTILGGTKSDTLNGRGGDDTLDGRGSSDTAIFAANAAHVINLKLGGAQNTGEGNDTLISIESIIAGNNNDNITGNSAANRLEGRGGNDILRGDDGNDVLVGGSGRDNLIGGAGKDVFRFENISDSGILAAQRDTVSDFTLVPAASTAFTDRLDFSAIDAKPASSSDDSFVFIKQADFSAAGQIRAVQSGSDTVVEINTVGIGGAEMTILLKNVTASLLSAHDFIL